LVRLRLLVCLHESYRWGAAGAVVEPGAAARADVGDVLAEAGALLAVRAAAFSWRVGEPVGHRPGRSPRARAGAALGVVRAHCGLGGGGGDGG
jgi:hypothetical protein